MMPFKNVFTKIGKTVQLSAFAEMDVHGVEVLHSMARLFERVPDIVFFAKDRAGL